MNLQGHLRLALSLTAAVGLMTTSGLLAQPPVGTPLSEPFRGVSTDGDLVPGLYTIEATGVSTEPIREGDRALHGIFGLDRRPCGVDRLYAADDIEWRTWHNIHRAPRQGVSFGEMTDRQRDLAFALFNASLSAQGVQKTRNVMALNEHLAELVDKHDEYGDEFYYLTFMGQLLRRRTLGLATRRPPPGHQRFVLGDQVVATPPFMGSEPVIGSGNYVGVEVMQAEQDKGLAFMRSLTPDQQSIATLASEKTGGNALVQAYNDNLILDYAGLQVGDLRPDQIGLLIEVIGEYVGNLRHRHAAVWMERIEEHLDDTWFAWVGGVGDEDVFYYRIQSPVILIEFDHQGPIAFRTGSRTPTRNHVHSVVRTPNGNDYGRDLLRQHYEDHADDPEHGHRH